jgi:conjugative transfer signal peptidase TraF
MKKTCVIFLILAILIACWKSGLKINMTSSLSKGLYRVTKSAPVKGGLIAFCLAPENPFSGLAAERGYIGRGFCPSGLQPLLKRLHGLPGDQVEISPSGVSVNGSLLPDSGLEARDRMGRLLPPSLLAPGPVPDGYALAMSDQCRFGFDSRYFGLVPLASISHVERIFEF